MKERQLLDHIEKFLYGNRQLTELDIEFQLALEEKILSLEENETLYWYCDYEDKGNLYDFYKTFERMEDRIKISPNCSVFNKSGIMISKEHGKLYVKTKSGYGKNWEIIST